MLKKVLIALAALIVVFMIVVVSQPDDYSVSRSSTIAAPPVKVFYHVNDFHHWNAWSPWAKLDPQAKNSFSGPDSGVGAQFRWSGNDEVGEGEMTIMESIPNEKILIKLHFVRPFEDTSDTEFTFLPEGDQTKVTWTMRGKHNLISKAMCLFMSMDKMIGGDFEKGLIALAGAAQSP